MTSEEGLTIKDVDLVFVIAFDLGDKVGPKKLGEAFKNSYSTVKTLWCPPEGVPEVVDVLFKKIIEQDNVALDPAYLELGRYARFKLVELEVEVVEHNMKKLVERFNIELYLFIHNAGIGLVTAWINLKGKFTTDDIITLACEEHLSKVKLNVKDAIGNYQELVTLKDFIANKIATPLRREVLFKDRSEIEQEDKVWERLRDRYTKTYVIIGVKEVECGHGCSTAEDVVNRHVKEVAGILMRHKEWREYKIDVAREYLGRNLSSYESHAIYLAAGASLFLGSPRLGKEIEDKTTRSVFNKNIAFRQMMLSLVTAMEFLALSHKILHVYTSSYRKKREDFQERKRRGELVNPSEYLELRSELTDALEEYNNVAFFIADPFRSILEYGKERYRLTEWVGVLRSALWELAELARIHYDERFIRSQLYLIIVLSILGIPIGVSAFFGMSGSLYGVTEFYERLYGLPMALVKAAIVLVPVVFIYLVIVIYIYRRYIISLYKEFEQQQKDVIKVAKAEKSLKIRFVDSGC